MVSFDDLTDRNPANIFKGLAGSVWFAPLSEDTPITKLGDASGLLALPDGYEDVGLITKDEAVTWSREVENSETMSWGFSEPTRRDITSDMTGLQFSAQEGKRLVMQLHSGRDLSNVVADAQGNVVFDKPDRPQSIQYRCFVLSKDGDGADALYRARWLPRVSVTDPGEQSENEENETVYPMTISAYLDAEFGTSMREFIWSPNPARIASLGFTA